MPVIQVERQEDGKLETNLGYTARPYLRQDNGKIKVSTTHDPSWKVWVDGSPAVSWSGNLTSSSKKTIPFSLLFLINIQPDGDCFVTFYSFVAFPVSLRYHFPLSHRLQKDIKVLRT